MNGGLLRHKPSPRAPRHPPLTLLPPMTTMNFAKTLQHAALFMLGHHEPHTQTSEPEREALRRHAAGSCRAVEIGVYEGFTTAILARAVKSGGGECVYAIDPFLRGRLGVCWGELIARTHVAKCGAGDIVRFVKEESSAACRMLSGEFDFIFVDGDHSWEGIDRDWQDWSERIPSGGIMALHDTRVPDHNPAVRKLGSFEYFQSHIVKDPRFKLVEQVDSLSVLKRL